MSKLRSLLICTAVVLPLASPVLAEKLGLGRAALPEEVTAWDRSVLPDGTGLKPGSGDVATGEEVFGEQCATCHGEFAEGLDSWPVLAGGDGSLRDPRPVKTIGSYWPYVSTVWDYVHRSMPFGSAQTISVDETYAITAFLLYSNGLVEDDFVLSNENFTEVVMPNVDGFYPDDRSTSEYTVFTVEPCMTNCLPAVPKVTKRAAELKVTPTDESGKPAGTLPILLSDASGASLVQVSTTEVEAAPVVAPEPMAAEPVAAETAVPEAAAPAEAAPAEAAPMAVAAAADPALIADGEKVFKKCAACHKVGDKAKNGTGPIMNGIIGRAAGTVEGFKYSKPLAAMGEGGLVWDEANLHAMLENPKGFIKGTKMSFAGLKDEKDRAAVIAYLATFSE